MHRMRCFRSARGGKYVWKGEELLPCAHTLQNNLCRSHDNAGYCCFLGPVFLCNSPLKHHQRMIKLAGKTKSLTCIGILAYTVASTISSVLPRMNLVTVSLLFLAIVALRLTPISFRDPHSVKTSHRQDLAIGFSIPAMLSRFHRLPLIERIIIQLRTASDGISESLIMVYCCRL